jgi:hypothetical protein
MEDPNRNPAPPISLNSVIFGEGGMLTKWTFVGRFDSIAEHDTTAKTDFGHMISMGLDRMVEHLKIIGG